MTIENNTNIKLDTLLGYVRAQAGTGDTEAQATLSLLGLSNDEDADEEAAQLARLAELRSNLLHDSKVAMETTLSCTNCGEPPITITVAGHANCEKCAKDEVAYQAASRMLSSNSATSCAHLLTWLNGRSADIYVHDKAAREPILLWSPTDGISIEDAIVQFCDKHNIDIEQETAG